MINFNIGRHDLKKILLIDDEKDFCFFIKGNLEKEKEFDVITSTESKEAIKLAKKIKPDLILLDIVMPSLSGNEVAEGLAKEPQTKDIPVIFLTAVVTQEEMSLEPIAKIGGQDFMAKTIGSEKIADYIRKYFEEKLL